MEKLISALTKFGLSEKEAKVYIECLKLGEATAYEIAIKTKLPRTLVYDILDRLINLTLASVTIKDNKKYFSVINPKRFIEIIEEKKNVIKEILPRLEILKNTEITKKPFVKIYEGKEGIKAILNDILNSNVNEFLRYGGARASFDVIPFFIEQWTKKRIKKKIKARYIYDDTKEARKKVKKNKELTKLVRYKFLPVKLESPTTIIIYDNKVVLSSWSKELFAVMIESKELAENQKKYFEKLWKIARNRSRE